jgi:hypothetical protein
MGDMSEREFQAEPDGLVGATFRVLDDGRLQVETDEGAWTLPREQSIAVALLIIDQKIEHNSGSFTPLDESGTWHP